MKYSVILYNETIKHSPSRQLRRHRGNARIAVLPQELEGRENIVVLHRRLGRDVKLRELAKRALM